MKKIIILVFAIIFCIGMANAITLDYFGNKAFRGTDTYSLDYNMNTGVWYCQKQDFFKDGTIINISYPATYSSACNLTFSVVPTLSAYSPIYTQDFINTNLYKTTALDTNFSVTADETAYFCVKENTGTCRLKMNTDLDAVLNYTGQWYGRWQNDPYDGVSIGNELAIYTGASFPISSSSFVDWTSNSIPEISEGGGYVYSDGTGNMFPMAGILRKVGSNDGGESFYFPYNDSNIRQLAMHLKRGAGSSNEGIKIALRANGTSNDIVSCNFTQANITTATFGEIVYCNVAPQNVTINAGYYDIYVECYTNILHTTPCDGTTTYIQTPVSRTPDGIVVGSHIEWSSFQADVGHELTHAYEDVVFLLGIYNVVTPQCNDLVDNDGDGFIDYPDDPSCSSISDNTEAPFDYTQCSDGIDNDFDGYIDLLDPRCTSASDNSEAPADASYQGEDDCLEGLGCVIYDSIPYTDSPFLHNWVAIQQSDVHIVSYLGGWSIDLDTIDEYAIKENAIIMKLKSNINDYNTLEGRYPISFITENVFNNVVDEAVVLGWLDYNNNSLATVLLNVTADPNVVPSPYEFAVNIYAYNFDQYEFVSTAYITDADNGFMQIYFHLNEAGNTYTISYSDSIGSFDDTTVYSYDSAGFGQIDKGYVANTIDSDDVKVYLNLIELTGTDSTGYETSCDTWSLPYHLKESFNGYASECGWNVDPDLWNWGYVNIINDYDSYMLYRIFDDTQEKAIYYDTSRYSTISFDLTVYDDSDTINAVSLFLYDLAFSNSWGRFYYKSNGIIQASEGANMIDVSLSMPTNISVNHKIVVDLLEDKYDYYLNGSKIASGNGFHNKLLNVEYFNGLYFQSANSHWKLDNILVYESDKDANPQTNSVDNPIEIPDADRSWCDLFYKVDMSCNTDSDCPTGECLPNKKCSHFDFTWCDENAHVRGNMCMVAGVSSCVLESTGDLILDNFFLFLVLLILLMGAVYLVIMFRR